MTIIYKAILERGAVWPFDARGRVEAVRIPDGGRPPAPGALRSGAGRVASEHCFPSEAAARLFLRLMGVSDNKNQSESEEWENGAETAGHASTTPRISIE